MGIKTLMPRKFKKDFFCRNNNGAQNSFHNIISNQKVYLSLSESFEKVNYSKQINIHTIKLYSNKCMKNFKLVFDFSDVIKTIFITALIGVFIQPSNSIVNFFSADDLRYTFGVNHLSKVPNFKQFFPKIIYSQEINYGNENIADFDNNTNNFNISKKNSKPDNYLLLNKSRRLKQLQFFDFENKEYLLNFQSATFNLLADHLIIVKRATKYDSGRLHIVYNNENNSKSDHSNFLNSFKDCHYYHKSNHTYAAISYCDETLKGVIIQSENIYVIHPIPIRHSARLKRSADSLPLHIVYKRESNEDFFCGIENTITSEELQENEAGVIEDVIMEGQKFQEQSELVVELAIFVDEILWRRFSEKHSSFAWQKLQEYAVTMLNNIQIMYKQPTAVPQLTFKIVRYEVFIAQPSALAPTLHEYGNAQRYLDLFCRYQRNLSVRNWDHALLLTGYDIHRGSGSRSISGIARLDGMCDPWNTCTLAEGLDFTSAFIGTHELGHSVGMRHDEPYCPSTYIMSASLGPGKVIWSTCSLRDYHTFLQRLDSKGKNCLRKSIMPEKVLFSNSLKPGQIYDANLQCNLMHGNQYIQVSPRQDHYDGICYMMWCGQGVFGRIVTSHPALEGTICGPSKWCQLGRCVLWQGTPMISIKPSNYSTSTQIYLTTTVTSSVNPLRVNGQWSQWSVFDCRNCFCSTIIGSIGVVTSQRTCNSPLPANGGSECIGSRERAAICNKKCDAEKISVNQYISNVCTAHKQINGDKELTGTGSQLSRYPQKACRIFCNVSTKETENNYRFYGDNIPDGTSCGFNRYCIGGECLNLSCDDSILLPHDLSCTMPTERCALSTANESLPKTSLSKKSLKGQWSAWSLWSLCSVSCGGGHQIRSRSCTIINFCEGPPTELLTCNNHQCSVASITIPQWTQWTTWNQCSVSCGRGSQARYRRCQTYQLTIAYSCPGQTMDIRNCDELPCKNNQILTNVGEWALWGLWSQCSTTCGPGTQIRYRECKKEPCDGAGQQRMACNLKVCAIWGEWEKFTECSRLCGKGVRSRSRLCSTQALCFGSSIDQSFCNEQPCSLAEATKIGTWSEWSAWGTCSVTCGVGVRRRTRNCQNGKCPGMFRESAICNEAVCNVNDASWGGWGYWSACSVTCNNGIRRRMRKCYGNGACYGNEYERENCNLKNC